MVKNISPKQRRIVKAKIKGKTNKEIGAIEYPDAQPDSQSVLVSRELNKTQVVQFLEQSKLIALKEHNITWSRIIAPINDALQATKYDMGTGDHQPDHTTRLRAAKQGQDLLDVKQRDELAPQAPNINLPSNLDEIQLIRVLKKDS